MNDIATCKLEHKAETGRELGLNIDFAFPHEWFALPVTHQLVCDIPCDLDKMRVCHWAVSCGFNV